jgi:hypothetical protein
MTRLEKIQLAIDKGVTYDKNTGRIYGVSGIELKPNKNGYVNIPLNHNNKKFTLKGHQFVFYLEHHKIVDYIDHIDGNPSNNHISNLRSVTHQQNHFNETKSIGYTYEPSRNKYKTQIYLNGKNIYLGRFNTPEEARQAYLDAKKIYHKI